MAGTTLVSDFDDVYFFPQTILGNQLMVDLDLYPTSGTFGAGGSAGLVLGNDNMAFGIFTNRF